MRRFRVPPEPRHWHARFLEGQTSTKLMDFDNFVCLFFNCHDCIVLSPCQSEWKFLRNRSLLPWHGGLGRCTNLKCCNVVDMLTCFTHDKLTHVDVRWKPCARRSDSWRWSNEPSQSPKNPSATSNEQRATYKLVTGWRNRRAHFVVVFFWFNLFVICSGLSFRNVPALCSGAGMCVSCVLDRRGRTSAFSSKNGNRATGCSFLHVLKLFGWGQCWRMLLPFHVS